MENSIVLIITISFIIFIAPLVSRFTKIPVIPIEIILGCIAAHYMLIPENEIFKLVAEVGFLYLMFLAGLEVDLKKLLKISSSIFKKSLLYVSILYLLSALTTYYLDLSNIFIVIMPLISIGLLAALKKEYGETLWIKLAITAGLIGEIVSIVVLTTVSAALEYGIGFSFYKTLFILILVFIIMIIMYKIFHNLIWWYPEIKNYLMPSDDNNEQDVRLSMSIFFALIAIMLYLHLELAFGAFIAGTFIATFFEHNKSLPRKLEHFGFGWLVPIFFISTGASFGLDSALDDGLITTSLLIAFAMVSIRLIGSLLFIKELGKYRVALFALSHSMPLTLLIAVATLAYHNHSIDQFYYYAFILASILEVLFGMVSIRLLNKVKGIYKKPTISSVK